MVFSTIVYFFYSSISLGQAFNINNLNSEQKVWITLFQNYIILNFFQWKQMWYENKHCLSSVINFINRVSALFRMSKKPYLKVKRVLVYWHTWTVFIKIIVWSLLLGISLVYGVVLWKANWKVIFLSLIHSISSLFIELPTMKQPSKVRKAVPPAPG